MNVSVIIPAYNAERYLKECLTSISSQSHRELELIVVNDGSTDSTAEILAEYALMEPRLTVITQKNKGLVSAWRTGLEAASAKYVSFVDADDLLSAGYLEELVASIDSGQPDLIVGSVFEVDADGEGRTFRSPQISGDDFRGTHLEWCLSGLQWSRQRPIVQARWGKLIKRHVALKAAETVPMNLTLGEDQVFLCGLLLQTELTHIVQTAGGYFYRRHETSMTNTADFSYWEQYRLAIDQIQLILEEAGYADATEQVAGDRVNAAVSALFKVIDAEKIQLSRTRAYVRVITADPAVHAASNLVDGASGGLMRRLTLLLLKKKLSMVIMLWLLMNRARMRV